jgi:ABC-type transport system substrate-binding protein
MSKCPQCNGDNWDIRVIFDTTPGLRNDSGSTVTCLCCGWKHEKARAELQPVGDGKFKIHVWDPDEDAEFTRNPDDPEEYHG